MDLHIHSILELNSKFYIDKKLTEIEYKNELTLLMQSLLLNFNTYLQLETHNIINKYNSVSTLTFLDSDNSDTNTLKDNETDNTESSRYNYQNNVIVQSNQDTYNIKEEYILSSNTNIYLEETNEDSIDNDEQYIIHFNNDRIEEIEYDEDNEDDEDDDTDENYEYDTDNNIFLGEENQCCARIGNKLFNLDILPSEFIDSYPSNTYITDEGNAIGKACLNLVNDYDENTNYFCDEHKDGYEDIRQEPKI